jgi:hypothetical protein
LTAQAVVDWDHKRDGETEFRPLGDRRELVLAIGEGKAITAVELRAMDRLLHEMGGDTVEAFLRIRHAVTYLRRDLTSVTLADLNDPGLHLFFGSTLAELRESAADQLFERYWPEVYQSWNSTLCACLHLDADEFFRWVMSSVQTVTLGQQFALMVVR